LENLNEHYYGFDIDLSTPASADDRSINNDDPITYPVIEKCSFQRNTICLFSGVKVISINYPDLTKYNK
jgi:hypothetical protein